MNRLQKRIRSERGAELIEFALTLPLLLLLVLGIIEFGFLFQEYEVVTNSAREGARIAAMIPSAGYKAADATTRAKDYLTAGGLDLNKALPAPAVAQTQLVLTNGKCAQAYTVTVTYKHPVPFVSGIMTYLGGNIAEIPLKAVAVMRAEKGAVNCS